MRRSGATVAGRRVCSSSRASGQAWHLQRASAEGRVVIMTRTCGQMMVTGSYCRAYRATAVSRMDMRELLNQAFSFRPTPESLTAEALRARVTHEVPADIDFELQLPLFKAALEQHRKDDVMRLMREIAKANPKAREIIVSRIERFTKQLEEELTKKQQANATSSNATKLAEAPKPSEGKHDGRSPDKMSMQDAVLHGQLSTKELEGVLRDLHRDSVLSEADEQQIKNEARALWEAGTAAVMAVDQSLPRHFTSMVIEAFPWADLLIAEEDSVSLPMEPTVLSSLLTAFVASATEVLNRQEAIKQKMSWISRLILPSIAPSKVKKGQTPHVYDAALDAVIHNELDKLLTSKTGEKYIEDTFRHVVQKFEDAPENVARTIAGTLHSTFVGVFIGRTRESGIDYYSPSAKSFAKKLLSPMKPLNPYFAQQKRELDAAAETTSPSP